MGIVMKAYLIGGGVGSLAAAAFMIRDAGVEGSAITIFEKLSVLGGSLDGARLPEGAYLVRGGRMLTFNHYECTWDLYNMIPSLENPGKTVRQDTEAFNEDFQSHSRARIVDKNRHKVDVSAMRFTMADRAELLALAEASEEALGTSRITDWLSPPFFENTFWHLWQTTFAFQPWHSAVELKRYLHRFMNEFPRIDTLSGVRRTVYNQYDAMVRPLMEWLKQRGVQFVSGTQVVDIGVVEEDGLVRVNELSLKRGDNVETVAVGADDLVFLLNASMTDASSTGSMTSPPPHLTKADSQGWELWEKIAKGRPEFGNPAAFNSSIPESWWESFTVTCHTPTFFNQMEAFSGNVAGTGGLVTFIDSNWLMSVVLYHQPHFAGQPKDVQVFWGYALHPDRIGNFVAKSMTDCTGADILIEVAGHLNFDRSVFDGAICIPCRMPYITSMFMPRAKSDRPLPVPKNSKNLAFVSQFVEIPEDCVFTVEYSVRAAQMAVYQLLNVKREVPPVTRHDRSLRTILDSVAKAFT
jgi:oleate hydratase